MDGKRIAVVQWPPNAYNDPGQTLVDGRCGVLTMEETYLGDRTERWIVQTIDGVEVSRHNPHYVESITWLLDVSTAPSRGSEGGTDA